MELWLKFQSAEECGLASEIWNKNLKEYRHQLEGLKNELSTKVFDFFWSESLHDGNLLSFTVINENSVKIKDNSDYRVNGKKKKPLNVQIQVLNNQYIYTLLYRQVEGISIHSSVEEELFAGYFKDFGDWGYHELTKGDSSLLCHEILFSTGTNIKIEFSKLNVSKKVFIRNYNE